MFWPKLEAARGTLSKCQVETRGAGQDLSVPAWEQEAYERYRETHGEPA